MNLSWIGLRNWLSVAGATFAGGAAGYLQANMTAGFTGALPWKQIGLGAAMAGLVAIAHLAQVPTDEQMAKMVKGVAKS